jgi:hypothetical protein
LGTTAIAAIWLQTSGDLITSKAYSDVAMTAQLGSTLTYTPTSPTKGTKVGIIKTPSTTQGSTVDSFSAIIN